MVHSHGIRPDTFLYARRQKRSFRMVSTIHNYVFEDLNLQYGKVVSAVAGRWWLWVWRSFDGVACLSQDACRYYRRHGLARRVFVVGNGRSISVVDYGQDSRHGVIRSFAGRRKVLGSNGALIKRKGYDTVIRALVDLPGYVFVVAGTGDDEGRLHKLARELGVADRVYFMGFQPSAEALIAAYDIFVLPSLSEGMPLAVIEAAAYSKPIVATASAGVLEMFPAGEVSFFEATDVGGFSAAVRYAELNASSLGAAARDAYEKHFSGLAMAERYASMYANLL